MGGAREASRRTVFCDTNVLIRLLTDDPPAQASVAEAALEAAAEEQFVLVVPDVVAAEVAYVLTTTYGLPVGRAAELLTGVLEFPGVQVADVSLLRDAIGLWSDTGLDFADAYLAALARRVSDSGVLSFDRDLDRIEGVTRIDPAVVGGA